MFKVKFKTYQYIYLVCCHIYILHSNYPFCDKNNNKCIEKKNLKITQQKEQISMIKSLYIPSVARGRVYLKEMIHCTYNDNHFQHDAGQFENLWFVLLFKKIKTETDVIFILHVKKITQFWQGKELFNTRKRSRIQHDITF